MKQLPSQAILTERCVRLAQAWDGLLFAVLGLALCAALVAPQAQAAPASAVRANSGERDTEIGQATTSQAAAAKPTAKPHRKVQTVITEQRHVGETPPPAAQPSPAVVGHSYSSAAANPSLLDPACAGGRCGWVESVSTVEPSTLPPGMVVGVGAPGMPRAGQAGRSTTPIVVAQSAPAAATGSSAQLTRFHIKVRTDDGYLLTFEQLNPMALGTRVRVDQGQLMPLRVTLPPPATGVRPVPSVAGKTYSTE